MQHKDDAKVDTHHRMSLGIFIKLDQGLLSHFLYRFRKIIMRTDYNKSFNIFHLYQIRMYIC